VESLAICMGNTKPLPNEKLLGFIPQVENTTTEITDLSGTQEQKLRQVYIGREREKKYGMLGVVE
jgi:hypothetical protein